MPHADASLVPDSIQTKAEFWEHILVQLEGLLEGQRNWVSNLANTSSLVYNSLLAFPKYFGREDDKAVNWCGFYVESRLFPSPRISVPSANDHSGQLLLGPFCGKPACQFINISPDKARGVCAGAFLQRQTLVVPDVDRYPGHIACDGGTKSEIVCPLVLQSLDGTTQVLGVFDLDCLAVGGFDEEDRAGLEKVAGLVVKACDW